MKLAEFLHPFRFIQKASAIDLSCLGPNLAVDDNDIDEDLALQLMTRETSRYPSIERN